MHRAPLGYIPQKLEYAYAQQKTKTGKATPY